MKAYFSKTWYTNFILTVIAFFLGLLVAGTQWRASSVLTPAYAQEMPTRISGFANPGKSAPVDTSNVATVQDLAVANATSEVAAANREIAAAIRDLAKAVQDLGKTVTRSLSAPKTAGSAASQTGDIQVEVSR
ncbi:MAG: hypothetical protein ACPL7D_04175 [Candidatus Sumerlaeaceae bacterium]|jgi:hypothetical protein